MDTTLFRLSAFRPLDWRYQRVAQLLRLDKRVSVHDDEETKLLTKFLRCLIRNQNVNIHSQLAAEEPGLHQAFMLRYGSSIDARSAVEARLLAMDPPKCIATRIGVRGDAVRWYAAFFFDLDERGPDFVLGEILQAHSSGNVELDGRFLLWKLVGFIWGPEALDELMYFGATKFTNQSLDEATRDFGQYAGAQLQARIALAMDSLNTSEGTTARNLLMAYVQMERGKDKKDELTVRDRNYQSNIEKFLDVMGNSLAVGASAQSEMPAEVREWEAAGIELRADDMMLLALGEKLPEEQSELYRSRVKEKMSKTAPEKQKGMN